MKLWKTYSKSFHISGVFHQESVNKKTLWITVDLSTEFSLCFQQGYQRLYEPMIFSIFSTIVSGLMSFRHA